jgi:hypothetical protein
MTTTDTTAAPATRRADTTRLLTKVPEIIKCDVQDHREAVRAPLPRLAVETAE